MMGCWVCRVWQARRGEVTGICLGMEGQTRFDWVLAKNGVRGFWIWAGYVMGLVGCYGSWFVWIGWEK